MPWTLLILAGLAETIWAVSLKYSDGFTKLIPSITTVVFASISFYMLAKAMKYIPIGTAYTAWVAIGAVGTVIFGAIMFGESLNITKIISVILILIGVIGLKISS